MEIEERLKSLPSLPGVYLMKNRDGKVIYVGKAASIKKRVASYFQGKAVSPKEGALIRKVADVDWIVTDSELEALVLECTLIKEYRPRYNIRLKDDKRYPMVKITTQEEFPRLLVVRKRTDEATYFGPFTDSGALRKSLRFIRQIFPISTCKKRVSVKKDKRPCLNFHMGHCLSPCSGRVEHEVYRRVVDDLVLFLRGHHKPLLNELKRRRDELARELKFEEAAMVRDQIRSIEALSMKQRIIGEEGLDQDVIAISMGKQEACAVVLNIRDGRLIAQRHFFLESSIEEASPLLGDFIKQYYLRADIVPDEIILGEEIPDQEMIEEWLKRRRTCTRLKIAKRGKRFDLLRLAKKNADLLLAQRVIPPSPLDELKRLLRLPAMPRRIEAFDVSNIKGDLGAASLVVFEEGSPKKEAYRHFRIKGAKGPDDPRMIREVVERRFSRLLKESVPLPDLVVVDGGRPQLNAAREALLSLGIDGVSIIGVAKGEEGRIYTLNRKGPIHPKRDSDGLHLLRHIMDEAHRFAHSYHLKLRRKR